MTHQLITGDSLEVLSGMQEKSVHCVVTSPPYWGLRDYGHDGQIGLESTPKEYVANMVEVFREVRRVLRDDGTLWLNLGDSYASTPAGNAADRPSGFSQKANRWEGGAVRVPKLNHGLKPKDLVGIPWRMAFALQADGWWLRSDIIWAKPNPMPESVTDRPTRSHEYIFLLSKSSRYYYDGNGSKEPAKTSKWPGIGPQHGKVRDRGESYEDMETLPMRNRRDVWTVNTARYRGAHFAVFPEALVEPCIMAATSSAGCCSTCGAQAAPVRSRPPPDLLWIPPESTGSAQARQASTARWVDSTRSG